MLLEGPVEENSAKHLINGCSGTMQSSSSSSKRNGNQVEFYLPYLTNIIVLLKFIYQLIILRHIDSCNPRHDNPFQKRTKAISASYARNQVDACDPLVN